MDWLWFIKAHIFSFGIGVRDAVFGLLRSAELIYRSQIVRWRMVYLLFSNTGLIVPIWLLNSVLTASYPYLPSIHLPSFLSWDVVEEAATSGGSQVSVYMEAGFWYLLSLLCLFLLILANIIVKPVSCFCYLDISQEANTYYKTKTINKLAQQDIATAIRHSVADSCYSICLYVVFVAQTALVGYLPYIGWPIWLLHQAILASVFAFDYPWFSQGISIFQRVAIVNTHWTYFTGFGAPIAVLAVLPVSYPNVLYAAIFPLYIISATLTRLPKASSMETPVKIPFFFIPKQVTEGFIRTVVARWISRVYQG